MMKELFEHQLNITRRHFLAEAGIGGIALASLMQSGSVGAGEPKAKEGLGDGALGSPHFVPKAKRVIYLFQSGGPSQMELFDYKPKLEEMHGQELPASVRQGQRLTGMSANQSSLPVAGSQFAFERRGKSGAWVSELMPHTAEVVDELCFIKSMQTDKINHDPAITFFQTGSGLAGRPSLGSWLSYGLGSDNENLPGFMVLISKNGSGQPLYSRLWGNGFLPALHQGVQLRSGENPVLYLDDPEGIDRSNRKRMLESLNELHELEESRTQDPAIASKIAQYEMAYRMQTSVPEVMDTSGEPDFIYDMYGEDAKNPGTYAANCLLARRLAEKGVKFIQLYHQGWDQHGSLPSGIAQQCKATDQASAALIKDLKQRGLLEDTLVVWGGEFGRTTYCQGKLTAETYGRDHHPRSFTIWMAGGGVKAGYTHGETDDFSYNVVNDPVHVHDFQATVLRLLGIDHEKLTYKHKGRRFRLTDVHGDVVEDIIA